MNERWVWSTDAIKLTRKLKYLGFAENLQQI
jgi:hypothetical protein